MTIMIKDDRNSETLFDPQTNLDNMMLVDCANTLQKHYPDHYWSVGLSSNKSVVTVIALNIAPNIGMVLHTRNVQNDPDKRCVVIAGGELLERARLRRGRCTEDTQGVDLSNSANVLDKKYHNNTNHRPFI